MWFIGGTASGNLILGQPQASDFTSEKGARSVHGPTDGQNALRKKNLSSPKEMNNDYLALHPVAN